MKSILSGDWYAPAFRVRIKGSGTCRPSASRTRKPYQLILFTTHSEPWRSVSVCRVRRAKLTALRGDE